MKRRQTILRQLLLNILVPVLTIFVIVFAVTYRYNTGKLEEASRQQKQSIVAETRNILSYYDYAMRTHEEGFITEMRDVAETLVFKYFKGNHNLDTVDLMRISREMGLDTSRQHIYLINRKWKVTNTTFPPDKGLDFAAINDYFGKFFTGVIEKNVFEEDRFGLEMKTGKIKKYAFLPTTDKRYIVELGFYSTIADSYRSLLLKKIGSLSHRFKGIDSVQLHLGIKGVPDNKNIAKNQTPTYLKCLRTEKPQRFINDNPNTPETEFLDFIYLDVMSSQLYDGYVLSIHSSDVEERELFTQLILYFGLLFLTTGLLITLIVYSRARRITRPIQELSARTEAIDTDNLNEHIAIGGSVELQTLSNNFNTMIDKLRISYEGLEDKVRERTSELNQQKEIVEHKNQEIIDSINYARFIQQAILPPLVDIRKQFPESFIYYQPKDIIAGDFYWFEQRGNTSWFAASDCTGHGVPGAMVSVLCINALNQTLIEKNCTEPGVLLDHVRDHVVKTFTKESQSVKDGMDISIACYNHDTRELKWTGANNPLWIFRNEAEVEIIAPDKQPVGQFEGKKPFTTNTVQLNQGDTLILFTDGFADQFGGPKQKKFKYAPFRELIESNINLNMDQLHELLFTVFNEWKGEVEQTDDVCVVGIRIN